MGDAIGLDRVGERLGDRFLPHEIGELLRPIAPGDNGVLPARLGRWCGSRR